MALRELTVKERIQLHLFEYTRRVEEYEAPAEVTQQGIAQAVDIRVQHVGQYVKPLIEEELAEEGRKHVPGKRRRLKVYFLTPQGRQQVAALRSSLLQPEVPLRTADGEVEQVPLARLYREERRGASLLMLLRELQEEGHIREIPPAAPSSRTGSRLAEQEIRFCTTPDGVNIAYATVGKGPPLVKAANWMSHLDFDWESPVWQHWFSELARDHRLARYDERGCGLSDWVVEDLTFEAFVRDLESVTDALGWERFPLLGISQGGPVAVEFAARHPDRVSHLVLYGAYARGWRFRDLSPERREEIEALLTLTREGWGRDSPAYRQIFTTMLMPEATPEQMGWFNDLQRLSTSPENAVRFQKAFGDVDVRDRLSDLEVPTLVLHARGDGRIPFEEGRLLASGIPGSRFVPLEGRNHVLLETEPAWPVFLGELRRFLGVEAGGPP